MTKEEIKKEIEDMNKPTIENAIEDVKMSKLLFFTKNGKILSYIADEYIENMSKYTSYCKEEEKDNWTETIKTLIYKAGEVDDYELALMLRIYEKAGKIMAAIENKSSWDEIKKITQEQGHSGMTISLLGQTMLQYSPRGLNFTERVIGKKSIRLLENLNNAYQEELAKKDNKKLIKK